jgi:hypothetical protein
MKWKWALKLPLTGTEAAGRKEGGGYVLCANDRGKSDESGNPYFLNLYLRNPELGYPLDLGKTGVKEMADPAFIPGGKLFGVTFTRLLIINTVTQKTEFVDGMRGMISRDPCADRS